MAGLKQYQIVRIRALRNPPERYDGWGVNQRPPRIGDVGTIVDIVDANAVPTGYVVECSGPDGRTIWLSDFIAEELDGAEG